MKKYFIPILLFALLIPIASYKPADITPKEVLNQIPFVDSFKEIKNDPFFGSTYEVWFKMPLDHNNPNSPVFPLKGYYSHKDFNKPMVVVIDGYTMYTSRANEITKIIDANQLTIEHRFFDKSRPKDSIPWTLLSVKQAAADQHQIIEAFKPFYKGKWISTGISKSGQATIYHKRFYPKDVDVSVPYVAPLNFSSEDPRVYPFLKNIGTEECRNKIYQFQLALFKNKKVLFPMFEALAQKNKWEFIMGLNRAYDLSVLEYSFAFWQWGIPCHTIPDANSTPEILFKHFKLLNTFTFFEEKETENVRPFFYQAMTEIGMYGYEIEPFKEYLKDTVNITFDFTMPKGHKAVFNPELMKDINLWLRDSGNYMLHIYGQYDAWSSTAVETGNKTNAVKMVNPGGSHGTRILSFPQPMQDSIYHVLGKWLDMKLPVQKNKP
jgi:hypothetical protein